MTVGWPKLRPAEAIRSIVFFGLLYSYLWLVVQPCLIYSCGTITNFPVFYQGGPFFRDCMSYPGGPLRYLCALLPQFFYYSWAGALVITGQAWAIFAGTGWFLRTLAVPGWRWWRFVPTLLVVVPYARYAYHFPTITGSLASLLFGCLYVTVASRAGTGSVGCAMHTVSPDRKGSWCAWHTLRIDMVVYFLLSVASYLVSAAAYLPFAVLCAIYELLYRRRYVAGLVYLLLATALPYVAGVLILHVSILSAYTDMLPLSWQIRGWTTRERMIGVVYALCLFPIALELAWGLWRASALGQGVGWVLGPRVKSTSTGQTRGLRTHPTRWLVAPAVRGTLASLALFAVSAVVAVLSLDGRQRALLAVHYYACQRRWPEVLEAARHCPDHYTVMNAVNRALYHTGRLNRDMFLYPQHPDALVLTGEDHSMSYWHKFDTLIDLGLVNLAEKNLTECMETFGTHPLILQRLALVNLVKGKVEAARIYLGALQKSLFLDGWARDYLARLEADPTLAGDVQMQQWRRQSLRQDSVGAFFAVEPMLATLVAQGGQNRMAYEYLMAWYLAAKQMNKFAQNLGRLTAFGYTEVPLLYQEAALIYASREKKPIPVMVSLEVRQRIEHFAGIYRKYGGNRDAAFGELAKEYWGSYFLYNAYGLPQAQK